MKGKGLAIAGGFVLMSVLLIGIIYFCLVITEGKDMAILNSMLLTMLWMNLLNYLIKDCENEVSEK